MDFKLDVEHRVSGGGWRLLRHNSMFVHPRIPHLRHNRHRLLLVKDRNALARNCRHKNSSSSSWARGVGCERGGILPTSCTHTHTLSLSLSLCIPDDGCVSQEKGLTHSLQCGCCVCSRTLCPVTARPVPTHRDTKQRVSKGRHPFQQVPTRGASSEHVQHQSTHTHALSPTPIHTHPSTHTHTHTKPQAAKSVRVQTALTRLYPLRRYRSICSAAMWWLKGDTTRSGPMQRGRRTRSISARTDVFSLHAATRARPGVSTSGHAGMCTQACVHSRTWKLAKGGGDANKRTNKRTNKHKRICTYLMASLMSDTKLTVPPTVPLKKSPAPCTTPAQQRQQTRSNREAVE